MADVADRYRLAVVAIALAILNYNDLGAMGSVALIVILMGLGELYISRVFGQVRSST